MTLKEVKVTLPKKEIKGAIKAKLKDLKVGTKSKDYMFEFLPDFKDLIGRELVVIPRHDGDYYKDVNNGFLYPPEFLEFQ